jgi:hypothetical protein
VLTLHYRLSPHEITTALTPTFIPPEAIDMPGYSLLASPTLYPGQTVHAAVFADDSNRKPINVGLLIQTYGEADRLVSHPGQGKVLTAGESADLEWQIPDLNGAPVAQIGLSVSADEPSEGSLHLDHLSWEGSPSVVFRRPETAGSMWKRQWVNAADSFLDESGDALRVIQNRGRGLLITGTNEWKDYCVQATLTPHLARTFGLAARVQGQERYYALLFSDRNQVRLVRRLDGENVLAERTYPWDFGTSYTLRLDVKSNQIQAWVNDIILFRVEDPIRWIPGGGIALVCEEGRLGAESVSVTP